MALAVMPSELRLAVVRMYRRGRSLSEIADLLGVPMLPERRVKRWTALYDQTGAVDFDDSDALQRQERRRRPDDQHTVVILALVMSAPTLYLDELQDVVYQATGDWIASSTLTRHLRHLGIAHKVCSRTRVEGDALSRAMYINVVGRYEARQLVFVDESHCSDAPTGRRRDRVRLDVGLVGGKRWSCMPVVTLDGALACLVKPDGIDRQTFHRFLKDEVLPLMNAYPLHNSVLIVGNSSINPDERIVRLFARSGSQLVCDTPRTPDLKPDEKSFAIVNARIRLDRRLHDPSTADEEIARGIRDAVFSVCTAQVMRSLYRSCGFVSH